MSFSSLAQKLSLRSRDDNERSNAQPSGSFICPQCMAQLPDANELQAHFTAFHENNTADENDATSMRSQLNDLRTTLKEEKKYSSQLKQQIEDLQKKLADKLSSTPGEEANYYVQQIHMLEAGKALSEQLTIWLTSQMLEMEKQLAEIGRQLESAKRENSNILEKSARFSQQNADLSAKLDEEAGQKDALTENLHFLQEKIVDLEAQLDARPSEDDVIVLRRELVHAQTLMNDITCAKENDLAKLRVNCIDLDDQYKKLKDTLQAEAHLHQEEFAKIRSEKLKVEDDAKLLKNEISDQESQMIILKQNFESTNERLAVMTSDFSTKQIQLDELTAANIKLTDELRALCTDKEDLLKQHQTIEQTLAEKVSCIQELRNSLDYLTSNLKNKEQQTADAHMKIGQLQSLADKLAAEKKNLAKEKNEIVQKLEADQSVSAILSQLTQEKDELQRKFDVVENNFIQHKEFSVKEGRSAKDELSSFSEKLVAREEEIAQLRLTLSDQKDRNLQSAAQLDHLHNELDAKDTSLRGLEEELEKSKANSFEERQRLLHEKNAVGEEFKLNAKNLKNEIERLTVLNASLTQENLDYASQQNLQRTVDELKSECHSLQEQLKTTAETNKQESNELNTLVTNLEQNMSDLREERDQLEVDQNQSLHDVEKLTQTLAEVEKLSNEQKDKVAVLTFEIISKNSVVEELTNKLKSLEKASYECSSLKSQLHTLQLELKNLLAENKELKVDIDSKQFSYVTLDAQKVQLELTVRDITRQADSQDLKIKEIATQKNQLENVCKSLEQKCARLEDDSKNVREELKNYQTASSQFKQELQAECSDWKAKFLSLQNEKRESDSKSLDEISHLKDNVKKSDEFSTKIRMEFDGVKAELESNRKELRNSVQSKKDLEAQLSAWNDEKRILLEKCVFLEKYLEEEKDNERELKRRLDNAVSALYDLGREHQSMQVDISKHFNRKWADDREAIECLACSKLFSVTVRKHHCRHCGLIFCNECSNKTHLVPASKKPVRVCENCFKELTLH